MVRKIIGPKRDEVICAWRLPNEELYDLYLSPHIIRAIESIRMRSTGHMAHTGGSRGYSFGGENLWERNSLKK